MTLTAGDTPFTARGRGTAPDARFRITLADGFTREYWGRLRGDRSDEQDQQLLLTVEMPVETATGSIVGAELPTHSAARGALAAQAVVARSFLIAGGRRHEHADFCDTTHCQFLRSPAVAGSVVDKAVGETRGLVLTTAGTPFAALYSAACGGETEQLEQFGYLYQRVRCEICLGMKQQRSGHGLGLCQNAALELARQGWPWRRILQKYYPGADIGRSRG
jgi:peptidoglycan hydrolase-like amidase